MKARNFALTFSALALAAASFTVNAGVVVTNLGDSAPPPVTLGTHVVTPFNRAPQAAISEYTEVTVIPGNPFGGVLAITPGISKYTAGQTWGTGPWAGGFLGPIFFTGFSVSSRTMTLPANTKAFYFYLQNNDQDGVADTITVTTDSGATSGPLVVTTPFFGANVGAYGLAVYGTAGESITSITVQTNNTQGFAIGNFGIAVAEEIATTCASEGYKGAQLTWCKNICENGLTGQVLDTWIHRWISRYRDLPYCAVEDVEEENQPQ